MEQAPKKKAKKIRWGRVAATVLFICAVIAGIKVYNFLYESNVPTDLKENLVQIPSGADLNNVVAILKKRGVIKDEDSFRLMAEQMKYRGRSGQFRIEPGWTNRKLIRHLRGGQQEPVRLILVNERLVEDVSAKAARFIEADSLGIVTLLKDPVFLDSLGYNPQTIMTLIIPNTYEFFWNTSPRKFVKRMVKEHNSFWDKNNRTEKAGNLNLTKQEVYTLASIVERETNQKSEKARVAGLYYNRIRKGMLLQADPTLVFASRDWESRSLAKYKTLDSPYNTYMYPGLPPGPISMASIPSIDAVLNREEHKYIYMCARGDESGLHNFSVTLRGHNKNIQIYKRNLRKRGLM
ncbi:MAG: endolytic transglycosylase MltG [Bacteroidota bacterium]